MKFAWRFFDKLEDHVRVSLSHYPLLYSIIGGMGIVLFWRGIWHIADIFEQYTLWGSYIFSPLGSMALGILILLSTGLLVSSMIGESILLTSIRREKKLIEKTEQEIEAEIKVEDSEKDILQKIEEDLEEIKGKV